MNRVSRVFLSVVLVLSAASALAENRPHFVGTEEELKQLLMFSPEPRRSLDHAKQIRNELATGRPHRACYWVGRHDMYIEASYSFLPPFASLPSVDAKTMVAVLKAERVPFETLLHYCNGVTSELAPTSFETEAALHAAEAMVREIEAVLTKDR